MSNDLDIYSHLPTSNVDAKELAKLTESKFLPYIQQMQNNAEAVAKDRIQKGNYALMKGKNMTDLSREFNFIPFAARPKAMRFNTSPPTAVHDQKHPEFLQIQSDSTRPNSNCGWGPEFLVYIPSVECFAAFFFGNPTYRSQGDLVLSLLRKPVTVTAEAITREKQNWWGGTFNICSAPFTKLPPVDEVAAKIQEFLNPPKNEAPAKATTPNRG